MRVFACPRGPEAMIPDALSERANYQPAVKRFETAVADLLRAQGYTGARTGKVVQFPIADGYEASRAYRALVKHFGRPADAVAWRTHRMYIHPDTRRCWISPKPTANTNHDKGWGRLIHDASHRIFHYRHPGFRPHDGGHAQLETEIAAYVAAQSWLTGALRPKAAAKPTREERRALQFERTEVALARWGTKLKRAQTALRKLRRKRAALARRMHAP